MGKTIVAGGKVGMTIPIGKHIYGAEWDGSSTTVWARTDNAENFSNPNPAVGTGFGSSPFDACYPWNEIQRVIDSNAGELVEIPIYWYKWTRNGSAMKLQIADYPANGFLISPAHADRGDGIGVRNHVYVGRYQCVSGYKSLSGSLPQANITRPQARSSIHNLGSNIWQFDFAMYWTIMMLYLVEYADWNSQKVVGYGCSPNTDAIFNTGATDIMNYHTGTSATSRTAYGSVQYRWIEGLWSNAKFFCDGIWYDGGNTNKMYCFNNPSDFKDGISGGTVIGDTVPSGYPTAWTNPTVSGFEYALIPSAVGGSDSTYVCDYASCSSNRQSVLMLGEYYGSQMAGAFMMDFNTRVDFAHIYYGCRLMKLP